MRTTKLDKEEQEILNAYEAGEFESVMTPERKQFIKKSAEQACKEDQRINISV